MLTIPLIVNLIAAWTGLSGVIWIYLLLGRGGFWQIDPVLFDRDFEDYEPPSNFVWPTVAIVIPARNEATMLPQSLPPLLTQDYPGDYQVYLVDDQSEDDTGAIVANFAQEYPQLKIIASQPLESGWTGKLWALHQGLAAAAPSDYVLLTDADICHDQQSLRRLVLKATIEQRDLVSLMVQLRVQSFWEQLLIPAFVFFFAKLYPFQWVNQPGHTTAAAAGGCSLVRRDALTEIGGIAALRDALIDDCTLAAKIKHRSAQPNSIYLGLTQTIRSLRPYDSLESIWNMVARTAYTQLNYLPLLLLGTIVGMALVYLTAPIGILLGLIWQQPLLLGLAIVPYALMTIAYWPTVCFYRCSPLYALALPLIGLLYNLMTIDSARRHWQGQGGNWKGRTYSGQSASS